MTALVAIGGLRALYTGVVPTVCRGAVLFGTEMCVYESMKTYLEAIYFQQYIPIYLVFYEQFLIHCLCATIASIFSALNSSPFDVVRARIMKQSSSNSNYISYLDCVIKIIREEGFLVLWKGCLAYFCRLVPNTIITYVLLERLRLFLINACSC